MTFLSSKLLLNFINSTPKEKACLEQVLGYRLEHGTRYGYLATPSAAVFVRRHLADTSYVRSDAEGREGQQTTHSTERNSRRHREPLVSHRQRGS